MKQLELPLMPPPEPETDRVVNIASVKHRSPFRYPGGKTWLVPRVIQWLDSLPKYRRTEFIEPFAGGAIVGLSVAFEELAQKVTLVELDEQIAAVWETIINQGDNVWLAERIRSFQLTLENVNKLLSREGDSTREAAFQTIVKNRVNRGGILAPGAGKIKHGENGKGIASRWYAKTLSKRILDIETIRDTTTFIHGDGLSVIEHNLQRSDVVFFIDPPYTAAGKKPGSRLYTYSEIDHEALFRLIAQSKGDFLLTYDNIKPIRQMAEQYEFDMEAISMKNSHHAKQTELLIGKDLNWVRTANR